MVQTIDELKTEHYDYVVKKTQYSGFWKTNLDAILKKHGVKEVYLAGTNTGFCVFCTGLDAFCCAYDRFLIEDATMSIIGRQGVKGFAWFCGSNVVTTNTLLRRL